MLLAQVTSPATNINGKWTGSVYATGPDGKTNAETVCLILKEAEGTLTGTAGESEDSQWPITTGAIKGDKISFDVLISDGALKYELVLTAGHLKGEASTHDSQGKILKARLDLTKTSELAIESFRTALAEAQYRLGRSYRDWLRRAINVRSSINPGELEQKNTEAAKWYRMAAEQGNAQAQFDLGSMYIVGSVGIDANVHEGLRLWRLAASQGHGDARKSLAGWEGLEVWECEELIKRQDYPEAMKCFRRFADQGNGTAQSRLGLMYADGQGATRDYKEAVKWYRLAAEQGNARAQRELAFMYRYGHGVASSRDEAIRLYRLAALQGDAEAQISLGQMYREIDLKEAPKWSAMAAANGHRLGPIELALSCHLLEERKDYVEAAKCWRLAAEQDNSLAQFNLASMYVNGQGVTQDYQEALKWFRVVARRRAELWGVVTGRMNLGLMYERGWGTTQDYVEAHLWYNLAASAGESRAAPRRDALAEKMSPAQIEQAQSLARTWTPDSEPSLPAARAEPPPTESQTQPAVTGSGFIVSAHEVVTSYHVIRGCSQIRLSGSSEPAGVPLLAIAATDVPNDLALLKSETAFTNAATFSNGSALKLGESVIAVGYPLHGVLASSVNVTAGTVSATAGPADDTRLLQMTAPVQPGSSGGPLLDLSGLVVGVVAAQLGRKASVGESIPQNVNFAIKASLVREFLDSRNVHYHSAPPSAKLAIPDIASKARQFTVAIECWK